MSETRLVAGAYVPVKEYTGEAGKIEYVLYPGVSAWLQAHAIHTDYGWIEVASRKPVEARYVYVAAPKPELPPFKN
jgi:hypothetical protein